MMSYLDIDPPNWRNEDGLINKSLYKKKWALKPVICADGTKVWFDNYYSFYKIWTSGHYEEEDGCGHTDFIENITEAEYLVRKLADNL